MASVPSAGCLLAKNQYYRTRQNSESSVSSSSSCCSDTVNITDQDKTFNGLPEIIDKYWWIKSFFHSEPSPPTVGRKTLSASRFMVIIIPKCIQWLLQEAYRFGGDSKSMANDDIKEQFWKS